MDFKKILNVALVGNPNSGKTTTFNRLTGHRQHVGNYPGVTVDKKEGYFEWRGRKVKLVDLPGTYSLAASSVDEAVVMDFLMGRLTDVEVPDVVICIADAKNISRSLYLASQIADLNIPLVLALNMMDEANASGISIDCQELEKRWNVPVVEMTAIRGIGIERLMDAVFVAAEKKTKLVKMSWSDSFLDVLEKFKVKLGLERYSFGEVLRLFFDRKGLLAGAYGINLADLLDAQSFALAGACGDAFYLQSEAAQRYAWIYDKLRGVILKKTAPFESKTVTEKIDDVLTHRIWGLLIFILCLFLLFQSMYTFAAPIADYLGEAIAALGEWVGAQLTGREVLRSLVVDGIFAGVGSILVFLPQILILFFFIAILEDSGYMARAAFLMDKLFSWCGLAGTSFVPLLSSFACAVPGIMATRTIANPRARVITALAAPFVSCSARLPVYVLFIGAFIEPYYGSFWAAVTLFSLHIIGLIVGIPAALLLQREFHNIEEVPFILEMPPYRIPRKRDVLLLLYDKGGSFLVRAGSVILAVSIIIWALSYFPHSTAIREQVKIEYAQELKKNATPEEDIKSAATISTKKVSPDEALTLSSDPDLSSIEDDPIFKKRVAAAQLENSYLGRIGKFMQPLFAPAGFDWRLTVAVISSFPARELVVTTLGILYNLGDGVSEKDSGLTAALRGAKNSDGTPLYTPLVAASLLIFMALSLQCVATIVTLIQEVNLKAALGSFVFMTVLAWSAAVVVYQVGSLL